MGLAWSQWGRWQARAHPARLSPAGAVAGTRRKLAELFGRGLSGLELLALFLDGIVVGAHCIVVALGVDAEGRRHPLGLWEGTTENKAVCQALLRDLIEPGLSVEIPRLFVIDGGKGLRAAITATFGEYALVQRCRVHKRHNVLDHLPHRVDDLGGTESDRQR